MNKPTPVFESLLILLVILSVPGISESNNIIPQATAQIVTSTLTVATQDISGNTLAGLYITLKQSGTIVATGFSPVTFTLNNGVQYTVTAAGYKTHVFDHWLDTGSTSSSRTITINTNSQITAVYRTTALSLNPTSGTTGTTVTVTGKNFAANSGIKISYDGSAIPTNPSVITTDSTGGFTGSITVPSSSAAGTHTVQATDASNQPASAQFTVTTSPVPAITLNPTSGPAGTAVNISGSNFAANSGITISYDNNAITTTPATITTDSTGGFTGSITVPSSSAAGTHTVKATDASANSASASFTVTTPPPPPVAKISLNPSSGPAGTTVTVTGTNFSPNSAITTVTYDGTSVTTNPPIIQTDSSGGFSATFAAPSPSNPGSHTVNATDASSNSASALFTVTTPSISLSPSSGPTGTIVNISGNNFAANSGITISYDNNAVTTNPATITTTSIGSFTASITEPSSSGAGPPNVKAKDA